jgi:hypothetical protein
MLRLKKLVAIMMLVLVTSLGAPQAFAGDISTPGITGEMSTPGLNGDIAAPGAAGDILTPGFAGWMGNGLAAIASLFN